MNYDSMSEFVNRTDLCILPFSMYVSRSIMCTSSIAR